MIMPAEQPAKPKGIVCPACGLPGNRVIYTRPKVDGSKDRVRECIRCLHQWQTSEQTKPEEFIDRGGRQVRVSRISDCTRQK